MNIPVRLYTASEESGLSFVTLDRNNEARIRYRKVNEVTGKEVKEADIVKAYDFNGRMVRIEEEDFQKAAPEKIDHLEILQFVFEKEIDAVYYEKPYYLEPEKTGVRAYCLLRDALQKEGKAALGPLVYHKREWVCLIKPMGKVLVLHRLRFAEEIRGTEGLVLPETTIKPDELKMAASLIQQLTKPFTPDQFSDTFSSKLLRVIEAKSKGKAVSSKHMKVVHTGATEDLMQKLKESLKPQRKAS